MHEGARIIVSHVSGERMKAQGTDGVSRGQLKEGVSSGSDMLAYIPFHLTALQRFPPVETWLRSWLGKDMEVLTPEGWFERGHDILGGKNDAKGFWRHNLTSGTFVWAPPAAASVAIEELRKARIKRQDSTHYFICPRLLTTEWLKQLYKTADIVFYVPPGTPGWPKDMCEPLTIGIVFPFLCRCPWQLRGTPKMFYLARQVRRMFKEEEVDAGNFLRELLLGCRRLYTLQADVVRRLLYFRSAGAVSCKQARGPGRRQQRKGPQRSS